VLPLDALESLPATHRAPALSIVELRQHIATKDIAYIPGPGDWFIKGVRLPAASELRATYKGEKPLGASNRRSVASKREVI
jgi:hypothetical protein